MNGKIEVRTEWDVEAKVWVARTEDSPGLATEAETLESCGKNFPG